jgi:UDP-glucose 4-epimerase
MKEVVVVTGGGGFIGHHLVKRLMADNQVVVLDNFSRGAPERLVEVEDRVIIKKCDITDFNAIEEALNSFNVSAIFHLAAINGTGNFYKIPLEIMDVGVLGCKNILDYAKKYSVPKVITASSAEVYQECEIVPTPEDVPLIVPDVKNPRFSYGLSKIYTEYYSFHYGLENNLNMSIFRPHNVFGPDMGLQHVIPQFIMEFLKKANFDKEIDIETKGSLDAIRAFCYVDDIIEGIILLHNSNKGVNVYNIGNTKKVSMRELLSLIGDLLNIKFSIAQSTNEHMGGSMLRCPDISKIEELGFQCSVSLTAGLSKTIDWYKKNLDKLLLVENKTY